MPIACLSMAAMFLATSFTVDLGRIMERGRALQLVADLAALDASRSVDPDLPASAQYEVVRLAALSSRRCDERYVFQTRASIAMTGHVFGMWMLIGRAAF